MSDLFKDQSSEAPVMHLRVSFISNLIIRTRSFKVPFQANLHFHQIANVTMEVDLSFNASIQTSKDFTFSLALLFKDYLDFKMSLMCHLHGKGFNRCLITDLVPFILSLVTCLL